MAVFHLNEVAGTLFPAGRLTRVLAGPGAPAEPDHFVMGHVTIYEGGEVPQHAHGQEEVYFIVSGRGTMELEGETMPIEGGSCVDIRPGQSHCLRNTGNEDLVMLFCYAPKGIVDHWRQELHPEEANG